jgi:phage shock protein C
METVETRRLYKSRRDKMIDGVCAGLAEYLDIHVVWVRIGFVLFGLFGGSGIIAYLTAMILLPVNPNHSSAGDLSAEEKNRLETQQRVNHNLFWGITLILVGGLMFLDELNLLEFRWFWHHFPWDFIFPSMLIVAGIALIISRSQWTSLEDKFNPQGEMSSFRRKSSEKKIWGVCAGIADYFRIDVSVIRILWVALTFLTFPLGALAYVLMAILVPDENRQTVFSSKRKEP